MDIFLGAVAVWLVLAIPALVVAVRLVRANRPEGEDWADRPTHNETDDRELGGE